MLAPDLNTTTLQNIFDYSTKHLFKQNQQSYGLYPAELSPHEGHKGCLYRGPKLPDGTCLMCAVGPFIPDDKYKVYYEGTAVSGIIYDAKLMKFDDNKSEDHAREVFKLLQELQKMHDGYPVCSWHKGAAKIADEFGLQFT